MSSDTLWMYLFVKLNDIRDMLDGPGMSIISLLLIAVYVFAIYPAVNLDRLKEKYISKYEEEPSEDDIYGYCVKKVATKALVLWVSIFILEVGMNITATLLPSTGQAAAIYIGVSAKNSDTAKTLAKLPDKYAKILEMKANKYLCDNAKEMFGDNIPVDMQDICKDIIFKTNKAK
jgi:hypothetical protein